MPDIYLVIDIVVIVALSILAMIVLMQNRKLSLNRIFAIFVLCINVWILANYISNDTSRSPEVALFANYFVFLFSYAAAVYMLLFTIKLANDQRAQRLFNICKIPIILIGIMSFTPLVASEVELQGSVYAVIFGPGVALYGVVLLGSVTYAAFVARRNIKTATGNQKGRLRVLFLSFCWTLPVLLTAQFILPALTGWFGLTNIGVLPMLIMVYGLYYGAVRHRLFDLKLITVRSLAYILVFGVISLVYVVVLHSISAFVSSTSSSVLVGDSLSILLLMIMIGVYNPLRKFFNKVTNSLFYKDAYDAQKLLDELNKIIMSTYDTEALLDQSANLLDSSFKPEFTTYYIEAPESRYTILRGVNADRLGHGVITLPKLLMTSREQVVSIDTIEEGASDSLYRALIKKDINVAARLVTAQDKVTIGYLLLGPKKSGDHYTAQDLKLMEIIASELAIAIQNLLRFEEIKRFNETLQVRINNATKKLQASNVRLKLLDESKDDFISMASHQLRTPLTSIKGYISMVLDGDMGKVTPEQRKVLEEAFSSSQRMVYLISDFLNVSRLQTGKFELEMGAVDLPSLITDEIDQLQASAQSRNIKLVYEAPREFPMLTLDENKIRQVMMNFIDNAIYYAKPGGGTITVTLAKHAQYISFKVADNGIGVPKSEQHQLFSKFYRATNARKARPDGTGIGLFMAKKVIVAHGGAILFESVEDKGSMFGFRLPLEATTPAAPAQQSTR